MMFYFNALIMLISIPKTLQLVPIELDDFTACSFCIIVFEGDIIGTIT